MWSEENLTEKQKGFLQKFDEVIQQNNIEVKLNEIPSELDKCCEAVVDVEHDENGGFVCVGIMFLPNPAVYVFSFLDLLRSLDLSNVRIIGHNVIGDLELLKFWGIKVAEDIFWDTMLIGHIIDSSLKAYGLKDMAKRELSIEYPNYDEIVGKRGLKAPRTTLDKQPIDLVTKYNAMDVWVTAKLAEKQGVCNYGNL